jgi:hypothetical protein
VRQPTAIIRVTPELVPVLTAVAGLIRVLGECENLPAPVMEAADRLRREVASMGVRDIGPPPEITR